MHTHGRRDHHAKLGQRTEPRPIATARLKVRLDHPGVHRVGRDALLLVSVVERFGSYDAGLLAVAVAFPGLWSAAVPCRLYRGGEVYNGAKLPDKSDILGSL